jgi:hypothetical protein
MGDIPVTLHGGIRLDIDETKALIEQITKKKVTVECTSEVKGFRVTMENGVQFDVQTLGNDGKVSFGLVKAMAYRVSKGRSAYG